MAPEEQLAGYADHQPVTDYLPSGRHRAERGPRALIIAGAALVLFSIVALLVLIGANRAHAATVPPAEGAACTQVGQSAPLREDWNLVCQPTRFDGAKWVPVCHCASQSPKPCHYRCPSHSPSPQTSVSPSAPTSASASPSASSTSASPSASASASASASMSASPSTSPSPAAVPSDDVSEEPGGGLPVTGPKLGGLLVAAGVAIGAGIIAVLVARRVREPELSEE